VNVQGRGTPFYRLYIQRIGSGCASEPLSATGTEQVITPAFMP